MGASSSTVPAPSPNPVPAPAPAVTPSAPVPEALIAEIDSFVEMARRLYHFNSKADTALSLGGMALSVGVVCAGVFNKAPLATILGAVMTAVVTAQRAFPFNQRWQFYRMLLSQAQNLATKAKTGAITTDQALTQLASLRLDFAQQIPRGSTSTTEQTTTTTGGTPTTPQ
jgi:hypothetical protein